MRLAIALGLVLAAGLSNAPPVAAGSNSGMQLALVCQQHAQRQCGVIYPSCSDMQYIYDGTGSYDIIVVAYDYTALTALGYALDYSSMVDAEFGGFNSCADVSVTLDQRPGFFAVSQAWSTCQSDPAPGAGITVGWMELWGGQGRIDFAPERVDGGIVSVDCNAQKDVIVNVHSGFVGGEEPKDADRSPCGQLLATEATTWGGVKMLLR